MKAIEIYDQILVFVIIQVIRYSIQDYPSDQTKGRSCSSCGDGWFWQVTIFVIDCYDVSDDDKDDGDG